MLVAAMNPCPCGFLTDPQKECVCTPLQIQRYRSRVSGPLLDRIDIQVEVPAIRYQDLASRDAGEPSETIRQRVNNARDVQLQRFQKRTIHANAQMGARDIKRRGASYRKRSSTTARKSPPIGRRCAKNIHRRDWRRARNQLGFEFRVPGFELENTGPLGAVERLPVFSIPGPETRNSKLRA
jgi:predicted ATPase with chaperone activity